MTQDNTPHRVTASEVDEFKKGRVWQEISRSLLEARTSIQERINVVGGDKDRGYTSRDMDIIRMQEVDTLLKLPQTMIEAMKGDRPLPDDFDPFSTGPLDQ